MKSIILILLSTLSLSLFSQGYIKYSTVMPGATQSQEFRKFLEYGGDSYCVGQDHYPTNPSTDGSLPKGGREISILKYDNNGVLLYHTYIGGMDDELVYGYFIESNFLYVIGETRSNDFPVTDGSIFTFNESNYFCVKMDLNGSVVASTVFAFGSINTGIMHDANGIYLNGNAQHDVNGFSVVNGQTYSGGRDGIFLKLDLNLNTVFSTYIGGLGDDADLSNIIVDPTGNSYYICTAESGVSLVSTGIAHQGNNDLLITKFDAVGNILYRTYYGGSEDEMFAYYLDSKPAVIDGDSLIFVLGTMSSDINITDGNVPTVGPSGVLSYVKFDEQGNVIKSIYEEGNIYGYFALSDESFIYSVGEVENNSILTTDGSIYKGGSDVFVRKMDKSLNVVYSKLFGGPGGESQVFNAILDNNKIHFMFLSWGGGFNMVNGDSFLGTSGGNVLVSIDAAGNTIFSRAIQINEVGNQASMKYKNGKFHLLGSVYSSQIFSTTTGEGTIGGNDVLISQVDSLGQLKYSTVIGGVDNEDLFYGDAGPFYSNGDYLDNDGVRMLLNTSGENFPVTDSSVVPNLGWQGAQEGVILLKYMNCPPVVTFDVDTLFPSTQSVCENGFLDIIRGMNLVVPGDSLPQLNINGILSNQPDIKLNFQWQVATSLNGTYTDIPLATTKNYQPEPTEVDLFFRRLTRTNDCCGEVVYSTSDTSSVIMSAFIAPTVDGGGAIATCPGVQVQIGGTPTVSGGALPYAFSWDNGADPIANPTVSVINSTIFTLTVIDDNGCVNKGQSVVNIVEADAGEDKTICNGDSVLIGGTPPQGIGATYLWTPNTTVSCDTCGVTFVNPTTNFTMYNLEMTIPVAGGGTCSTTDDMGVYLVVPLVNGFAGTDVTECSAPFQFGPNPQPGYDYVWAPGTNLAIGDDVVAQPTFKSQVPKSVEYIVTATNGGCVKFDTIIVTALNSKAGINHCGPRFVGYSSNDIPNANETFSWSVVSGTGTIIGATDGPTATVPADLTTYQLTTELNGVTCVDDVTVTSCGGCVILVGVRADHGCANANLGSVDLTAGGVGFTYSWSPQVGLDRYDSSVVHLVGLTPQTYTVTKTSIYDPSYSCSTTIDVNQVNMTLPVWGYPEDILTCSGQSVLLGESTVAGYSYEWNNTSDLSNPNISNPSHVTQINKNFKVKVVDNITGCLIKDEVNVTVREPIADAGGPVFQVCNTAVITLGSPALPDMTYAWSPGTAPWQNGTDSSFAQPEVFVAADLVFTLVATDTITGCTAVDQADVVIVPNPAFDPLPDLDLCVGESGAIGEAGPSGATYVWTPSVGLSCTDCEQPIASPTSTTTYNVSMTLPGGCTTPATEDVIVTVHDLSFTMADITAVCPANGVNIGGDAPAGMMMYTWTPNLLLAGPDNQAQTSAAFYSPSATLSLTVVDGFNCEATASVNITSNLTAPVASNVTMCLSEQSISIGDASNPQGAGITYVMNIMTPGGSLDNINSANPTFTPSAAGTYDFQLIKDDNGCQMKTAFTVKVFDFEIDPATYNANISICENACAELSVTPQSGVEYLWSPNLFLNDNTITNPTVCPDSSLNYTLKGVSAQGCIDEVLVAVTVSDEVAPVITNVNYSICSDSSVVLDVTVTPNINNVYSWSPVNANISSVVEQAPTFNASVEGSFNYDLTVTNLNSGCQATEEVSIDVYDCNMNQGNEMDTTMEDVTILNIDLLTNNSMPSSNDSLIATVPTTSTEGGTVVQNTDGTINYTPAPNFNGADTVVYTVCNTLTVTQICVSDTLFITVTPVNDAPTQGNEFETTMEDITVSNINLEGNNTDPESDSLIVTVPNTSTEGGAIVQNPDGTIDYTPAPNFNGVDTVYYTVCDTVTPTAECVNDTLFITVTSVNDTPSQGNEFETTMEDVTVPNINLEGNNTDVDGDSLIVTVPNTSTEGGTVVQNTDGTINYTPAPNFNGVDTVFYTVCDTVTPTPECVSDTLFITVTPVNDAPSQGNETLTGIEEDETEPTVSIDLTSNNTDIEGDDVYVSDIVSTTGGGTVTINGDTTTSVYYTPAPGFSGVDTVIYTVCDNGIPEPECVNDTLFVTVTGLPDVVSVPEGFSPNDDGVHDVLVITGLEKYPENKFTIFNRWGNRVYESEGYQNDWDGTNEFGVTIGGDKLPVATYFYVLDLGEGEDIIKGYIYLKR